MRKFIDGSGNDSSTATYAYLAQHDQFLFADLILIGEIEDPLAYWLTDWESPLSWPVYGKFNPTVYQRDRIESKIGLEVATMQFDWSPKLTAFSPNVLTANVYQRAQSGFFDQKKFRLWRTVMQTPGDANFFGACEYFGGRISETTIQRGHVIFQVNSFLEVVDQVVPPNVIENTSVLANYAGNVPVVVDNESQLPQFTVVAPSSTTQILAQCTSPTANKIYGLNKFARGFLKFNQGAALAGYAAPIAENLNFNVHSGGIHYNQFVLYGELPWAPEVGDTFYASTQPPINQQDAVALYGAYCFPYVPAPETAI